MSVDQVGHARRCDDIARAKTLGAGATLLGLALATGARLPPLPLAGAALAVGALSLLTSVLLRSTAAAMGTMFAALIAGTILPRVAPSWEAQKYLFVTNLPLPDYYSGSPPPIPGITLGFSVAVLSVWAAAGLLAAFAVFVRRDVLA